MISNEKNHVFMRFSAVRPTFMSVASNDFREISNDLRNLAKVRGGENA